MLIPINFLLSLICLLLLIKRWQAGWVWRILLLLCLVHSLNAGISTLLNSGVWHKLQPITGAMLPIACLLALMEQQGKPLRYGVSALPVLLMVAVVIGLPQAIDVLMPVIWLTCAGLMLFSLKAGSDALPMVMLERSTLTVKTWRWLAIVLISVALLDVIVSLLVNVAGGAGVELLLFCGNLLVCAVLSLPLVLAPSHHAVPECESESKPVVPGQPETGDLDILLCIERLMQDGLYRRADLNLALLARKAGIPARRVSAAINALRQQSVSQYVNGWRITEACERLRGEDSTIIEIMEEVGFQTKSNFNREFRRVCGTTPTEWRKSPSEQTELTR
ncbi:AraC family transcriptional regulator [Erwinia sp. JUb26]|uniref:helix-turn-helix domain-containing protein n=1 Tax=Erwinia sp. JUb26 TaxID=2485126 RepID=UPI000F4A6EDF|nr:AraC family transcriptional regulator [Erwinia sp. JUb26]ROR07802.1 AraC family transcriptional regulator [Erwinia sp. JUb26]